MSHDLIRYSRYRFPPTIITDAQFAKIVEQHITALNTGLEGLPLDRVRLHVCWGNWEGPHNHDIDMGPLLPVLYQARVGALPDHLMLVPGVIDSKSNVVEHPEVVAQRIEQVVQAVGDRERVVAGVDCGFGTFVGWEWVTEDVVWAKLRTLCEGADLASRRLWGKKVA